MPQNWIKKLNQSSNIAFKETVIQEALVADRIGAQDATKFLTLVWYAYTPFNSYNITAIPITNGITGQPNDIEFFISVLHRLENRGLCGKTAIAEIERLSLSYDSDLWNLLLRPVLLKDFGIVAPSTLFDKVLKNTGYNIPTFDCQQPSDITNYFGKLGGKRILEPNMKGVRVLAIVDISYPNNSVVQLYNKTGKILLNYDSISSQLAECINYYICSGIWTSTSERKFVFDGVITTIKNPIQKEAVFNIFDVIPFSKFYVGKWMVSQRKRTFHWLGSLKTKIDIDCKNVNIIDSIEVDLDTAHGNAVMKQFYDEVIENSDGIMIKSSSAPYICKKTNFWIKNNTLIITPENTKILTPLTSSQP